MLYAALALMTALIALFTIAWLRSPALRLHLEEPKYRLIGIKPDEEIHD